MIPRVWPGTSVIFAPLVVRPNRWSRDFENPMDPAIIVRSSISLCQVKGRACQARYPAPIAFSARLRCSALACSRYSYSIHDPVVQTYRSPPAWLNLLANFDCLGKVMIEVQAHDRGLRIEKPHVQMALEDHKDTRHCCGIRLQSQPRKSAYPPRNARFQRSPGQIRNDGAS